MSSSRSYMIVIGTVDATKSAEFAHYVSHARPLFGAYGGRPVGQYAIDDVVFGEGGDDFVIVMEYPTSDAIRGVLADPAYQALIPARTAAFPQLQILIASDLDPTALLAAAR